LEKLVAASSLAMATPREPREEEGGSLGLWPGRSGSHRKRGRRPYAAMEFGSRASKGRRDGMTSRAEAGRPPPPCPEEEACREEEEEAHWRPLVGCWTGFLARQPNNGFARQA
jgi:hypothetical protein